MALLLSLSVGYGLGWSWQSNSPVSSRVADNTPVTGEPTTVNPDLVSQRPLMQFTVSNPVTQELEQINLPIVNASELGPDWQNRLHGGVPKALLEEMRAAGLNVRQERTVTPVRLPDGRRVVVPIDYYIEQPFQ